MKEPQMEIIAGLINKVARNIDDEAAIAAVGREALLLSSQFFVPEHFIIPRKNNNL
jgi:glycine/serine hydroxymethyltransferase